MTYYPVILVCVFASTSIIFIFIFMQRIQQNQTLKNTLAGYAPETENR